MDMRCAGAMVSIFVAKSIIGLTSSRSFGSLQHVTTLSNSAIGHPRARKTERMSIRGNAVQLFGPTLLRGRAGTRSVPACMRCR